MVREQAEGEHVRERVEPRPLSLSYILLAAVWRPETSTMHAAAAAEGIWWLEQLVWRT